jgi:hypothetical protein
MIRGLPLLKASGIINDVTNQMPLFNYLKKSIVIGLWF